ncbi:MAG TPA: WYL domain-containing transcriptional regulator [Ignavibacteria bacterium]
MGNQKTFVHKSLLKRLACIDREIGEKRFPNKERLAKKLEVSSKTIQRDIDFVKFEYDAPIEFDNRRKGYFYTDNKFRLNPLSIDASDFLAIAVTEKVLEQYKDSPYAKHFKKFYEKLSYLFDDKITISAKDLENIISFQIGPVRKIDEKILEKLNIALNSNRRIKIKYFTAYSGISKEREIDPYHIINHQGDWYLIGFCHLTKEIKVFAVSRIQKIKLTNRYFDIPEDFNINKYFKGSFGIFESKDIYNVKLHIFNESVRYVKEKQWHESQKIIEQKDGSITMEMKVNNLTEIMFWILSLGKDCKVLKPKELRNNVIEELKQAILNYNI